MHTIAQMDITHVKQRRAAKPQTTRRRSLTRFVPALGALGRYGAWLVSAVIALACALAWSLHSQYAAAMMEPMPHQMIGKHGFIPVKSYQLLVSVVPLKPSAKVLAAIGAEPGAREESANELVSHQELEALCVDLEQLYPFSYEIAAPLELPDSYFDQQRKQYRLDLVLAWMVKHCASDKFRTIGVMPADVYAPDYNFLFGQAKLFGPACVASTARMGGRLGLAWQSPQQRWHGLVRHEFGHALGLQHTSYRSVMRYSDTLDGLDSESTVLTKTDWECLRSLHPVKWEHKPGVK
jgi:predicted Zn-dependent protease